MKVKFFAILLTSALAIQCTDQTSFRSVTYLENGTNHQIKIRYFNEGNVDTLKSLTLNPGEAKKVNDVSEGGKGSVPTYIVYLSDIDSAVIEFDAIKKSIHYGSTAGSNPSALLINNARNIFNYKESIISETKKR